MRLTESQLAQYRTDGYLFFPKLLDGAEVAALQGAIPDLVARDGPEIKRQTPESLPKIVYAPHKFSPQFDTLSRLPRTLGVVQQILDDDVYLYQSRVNLKLPFAGDAWSWHQDFSAWNRGDGMPRPHAIMTAVFIQDCNPANGPLLVIPGSHTEDVAEVLAREAHVQGYEVQRMSNELLASLADKRGILDLSGPAGSVAFIHPTLVHGSAANMTPWSRAILYLNYNAVSNKTLANARPWFMNNQDATPLQLADDASLRTAGTSDPAAASASRRAVA
ncbi:MAG: phytanoyl-CoA dioxygenase family protein [Thermoanaerobaculia bacterium]